MFQFLANLLISPWPGKTTICAKLNTIGPLSLVFIANLVQIQSVFWQLKEGSYTMQFSNQCSYNEKKDHNMLCNLQESFLTIYNVQFTNQCHDNEKKDHMLCNLHISDLKMKIRIKAIRCVIYILVIWQLKDGSYDVYFKYFVIYKSVFLLLKEE